MTRNFGRLLGNQTAFFLCDMQEAFRPNIKFFPEITEVCRRLIVGGKIMNIPLVVTEQYPKGLKHTIKELDISHAAAVYEKTAFSMLLPETEKLMNSLCDKQLKSIVLFGIEAHVCILHTALDLRERNYNVHVVADACSSRSLTDRTLAYERMKNAGCIVTTGETVLLELLASKDHPQFKEIQKLIMDRAPDSRVLPGVEN